MKYRVINTENATEVVTEDGSLIHIKHEFDGYIRTRFHTKIGDVCPKVYLYDELNRYSGREVVKYFSSSTIEEVVEDSINCLAPNECILEHDDTLFSDVWDADGTMDTTDHRDYANDDI